MPDIPNGIPPQFRNHPRAPWNKPKPHPRHRYRTEPFLDWETGEATCVPLEALAAATADSGQANLQNFELFKELARNFIEVHEDLDQCTDGVFNAATARGFIEDVTVGGKYLYDFGLRGSYRVVTFQGEKYVVFSGSPGLRHFFAKSRYAITSPLVAILGVSAEGTASGAFRTGGLMIVVYGTIEILKAVLGEPNDGPVAVSNVAFGVASGLVSEAASRLAAGAVLAAGSILSVAVSPGVVVVVAILAGIAVGVAITALEEKYNIRQKMANAAALTVDAIGKGIIAVWDVVSDPEEFLSHKIKEHERRLGRFGRDLERIFLYHVAPRNGWGYFK